MKAQVMPALLQWARGRARKSEDELASSMQVKRDRIVEWEQSGELSLKQLEKFAKVTHTAIGYLFLPQPPVESLPIPDFRTVAGVSTGNPSPALLDTIYQCQRRQHWYREYVLAGGGAPLLFIGTATSSDAIPVLASSIRETIHLNIIERTALTTKHEALSQLVDRIEGAGILVMRNGVVGNNTHRPLSVEEFRGFTLCDEFAPLVFVNAADSKAAQMFTLVHELVHLWLGQSGVSNASLYITPSQELERFCNGVAAEVLVPLDEVRSEWRMAAEPMDEAERLAAKYKVSTLVVLRRAFDADRIEWTAFRTLYDAAAGQASGVKGGGGDFYLTQGSRLGKRFARALLESTIEGKTLYRDAFELLGFSKVASLNELARTLKVVP